MKLLVKFPTRGRYDLFFSTFNKFHDLSTSNSVSYLISIDESDSILCNSNTISKIKYYPNTTVVIGESISKIDAINRDINEYTDNWDIIIIAADDTVPCVLGWDERIIADMKENYPDTDGVLFYNDGFWGDQLNTQCILGKKYYDRFKYVYHPGYKSQWCDNDFMILANLLGKQKYFSDVIIKHEHLELNLEDPIYQKNYIDNNDDNRFFEIRKNRLFDISIKKIKIVHLLLTPLDGLYADKQNQSMQCFDGIKQYIQSYTQQFSIPNKTLLPVDTCADPSYLTEKSIEGVHLSYGHYGAYLAHKRAILEEFSTDLDALIIVEGDVIFNKTPAEMAFKFNRACEFAELNDASMITFGNVGFGVGSTASIENTSVEVGDYIKIDHFISAHCYMITKKEREQIQYKLNTEKWHAWDIWLYWNYDKRVPIFRTKTPLVYEPAGFSIIDQKHKESNVKL